VQRLFRVGPRIALVISLALGAVVAAPPATATASPTVRLVVAEEIAEGDPAVVKVVLDAPAGREVTVRVDTRARTARAPGDYRSVHRRVAVPAGQTVVRLAIRTTRDDLDEPKEDFAVRLSRPLGADLGRHRVAVTIHDRDPLPHVRVRDATVTEPALGHRLGFTRVVLSAPSGRRVAVAFRTRGVTAAAGQDFVPLRPYVVFEPGDTAELVSVELLSDDRIEPPETMRLVVTEVRHATATRGATVTILDAPGG
jgi:hypothetical protein